MIELVPGLTGHLVSVHGKDKWEETNWDRRWNEHKQCTLAKVFPFWNKVWVEESVVFNVQFWHQNPSQSTPDTSTLDSSNGWEVRPLFPLYLFLSSYDVQKFLTIHSYCTSLYVYFNVYTYIPINIWFLPPMYFNGRLIRMRLSVNLTYALNTLMRVNFLICFFISMYWGKHVTSAWNSPSGS